MKLYAMVATCSTTDNFTRRVNNYTNIGYGLAESEEKAVFNMTVKCNEFMKGVEWKVAVSQIDDFHIRSAYAGLPENSALAPVPPSP